MTRIPSLPVNYQRLPGVKMVPPPGEMLAKTNRLIADAVATLGAEERGALTWIATKDGVNLAVVQRVNEHFEVTAWIAKSWNSDPVEAGIAGRIRW